VARRTRQPEVRPTAEPAPEEHLDAGTFEDMVLDRLRELDGAADADAVQLVFNLVRVANELIGDLEMSVHRPQGWSWAGYRIMFCVLVAGPLEPRQVAPLAGVTRASISAVLNTLERDGLVERRRDSEDRRVVSIRLTPKGRRAVLEGFGLHHKVERDWASALTPPERKTLTRLLRKMLEHRPDIRLDQPNHGDLAG
jgi:DNA-binding MarR family transcriptional regulator